MPLAQSGSSGGSSRPSHQHVMAALRPTFSARRDSSPSTGPQLGRPHAECPFSPCLGPVCVCQRPAQGWAPRHSGLHGAADSSHSPTWRRSAAPLAVRGSPGPRGADPRGFWPCLPLPGGAPCLSTCKAAGLGRTGARHRAQSRHVGCGGRANAGAECGPPRPAAGQASSSNVAAPLPPRPGLRQSSWTRPGSWTRF